MKRPQAVWTYAPMRLWGSLSASKAGQTAWDRAQPELTAQRDPWWKRLLRRLRSWHG